MCHIEMRTEADYVSSITLQLFFAYIEVGIGLNINFLYIDIFCCILNNKSLQGMSSNQNVDLCSVNT